MNIAKTLRNMAKQTREEQNVPPTVDTKDPKVREALHFGRAQGYELAAALVEGLADTGKGD